MLVDIVDDRNRTIGHADRADVLEKHFNFRTVHALLFDPVRGLLLQRLPSQHPRSPRRLGSSVAGYLVAGETYHHAIHRKVWNELRTNPKMTWLGEVEMIDQRSRKFVGVFAGHLFGLPDFDRDQIDDLVYLAPDELMDLLERRPTLFTDTFIHVYGYYLRSQATAR
jgi:isopentenyldiphosphate isomerase